jgi:single-strand DNA-binding protein
MNKVILTGRLTKDVDVKYTQNGKCVALFSMAVNGFKKEDVYFFNIVAWNKTAELCGNYLTKGSKVLIEGQLTTRSYEDNSGSKRTVTEIIASNVEFLESKKQNEQQTPMQQVTQRYNTFGTEQNEEIPF